MGRSLKKAAFGGLTLATLAWPAMASAADGKDVRVTNTAEEAVPVAVQGTPTVKVVGLPSEAFQKHIGNLERFDTVELTTVPAGRLLVIEYINAFESASGAFDSLNINTSDDEGGVILAFPFLNGFVDAHPRIIVGPGRTVSARNFGSADATLTVSGHYEPAPSVQ